jgi:colicin import membrane protein
LKTQILENNTRLQSDMTDIDASRFGFLLDKCDVFQDDPVAKKECTKTVRATIRELVLEAREEVKRIKDAVKEIRSQLKNRALFKREALAAVSDNIEKHEEEYADYKGTLFANMRDTCSEKATTGSELSKQLHEHPAFVKYEDRIERYNVAIQRLQDQLKEHVTIYKARMAHLKKFLKQDLSELERSVINLTIREERTLHNKTMRLRRKDAKAEEKGIQKKIKHTEKQRKKRYARLKKTIKKRVNAGRKEEKSVKRAELKLRKTLRKQGEMKDDIQNDVLKGLVTKYSDQLTEELSGLQERLAAQGAARVAAREQKVAAREAARTMKKQVRDADRAAARTQKERERGLAKAEKERERELAKAQKKRERELAKAEKERERAAKKAQKK